METTKIPEFTKFDNVLSLSEFHLKGNELQPEMDILLERNARTPLISAKLKSWFIGTVKYDVTGLGKYSASNCQVEIDGKIQQWPFTMIYIKK